MSDLPKYNTSVEARTRCAIYARFSSDQQREASVEDQVRKCRELADKKGWVVEEEYVRADRAISGTSFEGRHQLTSLLETAKQRPRPFDVLLIDDTSRLSRNLPQFLSTVKSLAFYEIGVYSVSQGLDSRDESAYLPSTILGLMDEQFIKDLAKKVHRGQVGRVLNGQTPGGRCYGYRNVPIEDPTRKGDYGRPFVVGVRREVVDEEAKVIRRIFEMYAAGSSYDRIARALRAEGIPAPHPPRRNSIRAWSADSIGQILRNEKYIGIHIWNRTKSVRDETGRVATRNRPREEWVQSEVPEWRIVSDELWKKVQEALAQKKQVGIPKIGGLERTARSKNYLFSGLLYCGLCGRQVSITDADGGEGRYGCGAHRYKGACPNATTIRHHHLEEQMLSWLTRDLLSEGRTQSAIDLFCSQLQKQERQLQAEAKKNANNSARLQTELSNLREESDNIVKFIRKAGGTAPSSLRDELEELDARIQNLSTELARGSRPVAAVALSRDELAEHFTTKVEDLQSALKYSSSIAKQILRKLIAKVTLTPTGQRGTVNVTVDFVVGKTGGDSGVMLNGTLESSLQQYGFSAVTVEGPVVSAYRSPRSKKDVELAAGAD